jgi:hypothetical protein
VDNDDAMVIRSSSEKIFLCDSLGMLPTTWLTQINASLAAWFGASLMEMSSVLSEPMSPLILLDQNPA